MISRSRGFTLLEVILVVVIVGILAAIAYPSYLNSVRKSNRASAQAHLLDIAQREQQFVLDNRGVYATTVAALNITTPSDVATRYTILITAPPATPPTFTASATPIAGNAQAGDLGGMALTVDNTGAKTPPTAW